MQASFPSSSHPVIRGAFFLTAAGMLTRVMGFFYRIFLSRSIGAEQVGIYQMIFTVSCAPRPPPASRQPSPGSPLQKRPVEQTPDSCAAAFSLPCFWLLLEVRGFWPSPIPLQKHCWESTGVHRFCGRWPSAFP